MSVASETANITGSFMGYLPTARIAEFRDDDTGKVILAVVEAGETQRQAINNLLGHKCQATIQPRTPENRYAPKTAILDFRLTGST